MENFIFSKTYDYPLYLIQENPVLTHSYLEIYLTSSSFGWYGYEWVKQWVYHQSKHLIGLEEIGSTFTCNWAVLNIKLPKASIKKPQKKSIYISLRAALTTHKLEWLEPWGKLALLELKCSNRELVYVGNTNVTQGT